MVFFNSNMRNKNKKMKKDQQALVISFKITLLLLKAIIHIHMHKVKKKIYALFFEHELARKPSTNKISLKVTWVSSRQIFKLDVI